MKAAFQSLIKVIIRPPRATFDERRLGVADFAVRSPARGGEASGVTFYGVSFLDAFHILREKKRNSNTDTKNSHTRKST